MAKSRKIWLCIVLTLVTCGIYGVIWGWNVAKEKTAVSGAEDSVLFNILMAVLYCAPATAVGAFFLEKNCAAAYEAKGAEYKDNKIMYGILSLVGLHIVTLAMMQSELNKIAE